MVNALPSVYEKPLGAILSANRQLPLESYQKLALAQLRRAFDADAASFFISRPTDDAEHFPSASGSSEMDGWFDFFEVDNLDARTQQLYHQYYGEIDPFAKALMDFGARISPLATDEIHLFKGDRSWERCEFYVDFMRPRNVHHQLYLRLVDGNKAVGLVSLYRALHRPTFTKDEIAIAQLFSPVLTNGLMRAQSDNLLDKHVMLLNAQRQLKPGQAIIIVDRQNSWLATSSHLEKWLADADNAERDRFHRQVCHRIELLGQRMQTSGDHCEDARKEELVRAPSGQLMRVRRCMARDIDRADIVTLTPLCTSKRRPKLEKYGLSNRQTEVAQLLLLGLSTKEIAARLFLSTATVNNHVSAIYEKTGINSRPRLICELGA